MVDSIEDLSSNDIQEKYTTYSNTLKKTVKDLYRCCKSNIKSKRGNLQHESRNC